jgi:GNAT superfamily N-acetyltransferase
MREDDLASTAALLNTVFAPDPPVGTEELGWYYRSNPEGEAAVGRVEEGGRQVGNYSLVPLRFDRADGTRLRLGLGVDLAVHPEARGTGTFRATVEESYRQGMASGLDGILGVANAQSSPRMVNAMGWRLLPPLPLRILLPRPPGTRIEHLQVDSDLLASGRIFDLLPQRSPGGSAGFTATWSADLLVWRLARPRGDYVLHVLEDLLVVSTRTSFAGLPVAVALKTLPRHPILEPLDCGRVAGAIAAYHHTPLVVHWGINPNVAYKGPVVPRRLQPRPLDLVLHPFTVEGTRHFDPGTFAMAGFEFLDFDAY